jgi:conjugal transfer mating pair stabilization protein TraG
MLGLKTKNPITILFEIFCLLLLPQTSAFAASANEYYTYNGYGPVKSAFEKIALIFSSNNYLGFFYCFAVMAMVFGGMSAFAKMIGGRPSAGGALTWMLPVFFGTAVYLALIVPKTHIELYDPVLNQHAMISDIPVGIVYTATMLNHVERSLVDIVNTTAPVAGRDFMLTAGGIGIDLLGKSVTNTIHDANASRTMGEFVQKCVMFELVRPGTTLSMQTLLQPPVGITIIGAMVEAKNPAIFTMEYMIDPAGAAETCSDVYDELLAYYTTGANMSNALSNACGAAGIDLSDAAAKARCQTIISDSASNAVGSLVNYSDVISNASIAQVVVDYFKSASPSVATQLAAAQNISQSGAGEGFSSIFNSVSRAAFTAFIIALIPVIALFIPTPFCRPALMMIFGLFVWTIVWNICELVAHQFFMEYYYRTISSVTNSGFGIQAMLDLPSYTSVAMGQFGKLKAGAAGFATVVTGGIFKFGGSEMSHFAGRMAQSVTGSQGTMIGSAGRANAIAEQQTRMDHLEMARMSSPWANQGAMSMGDLATGKSMMQSGRAAQGLASLEMGGGNSSTAFDIEKAVAKISKSGAWGNASSITSDTAFQGGKLSGGALSGAVKASGNPFSAAEKAAFVNTMQKYGDTDKYSDMVADYAKSTNIDMTTQEGRTQAYGEFAALKLAPTKAVMDAFSDKDSSGNIISGTGVKNYQQFQDLHYGKSRGQMGGEERAFLQSGVKSWGAYHAIQSQMQSGNSFKNAEALQNIADEHYAGKPMEMFSDLNRVQTNQTSGNAAGVLKEQKEAMKAGIATSLVGNGVTDKETIAAAQSVYESGGVSAMKDSLAKSKWGQENPESVSSVAGSAHGAAVQEGVYSVAKATGEEAQLRNAGLAEKFMETTNPNDVRTGAGNAYLKGLGANVDAVALAMEGSGLNARQAMALTEGLGTMHRIAGGQMDQMSSKVMFGSDDPEAMMKHFRAKDGVMSGVLSATGAAALNKQLGGKAGFAKGDQITYAMGADGSVKVANAQRGGFKLNKKGNSEQIFDNKFTDTGTVKESRKQDLSGVQSIKYNENKMVGNYKAGDGKEYTGTLSYGEKMDGTPFIISGQGSSLQEITTDSQFTAPDGKMASTKSTRSYSQDDALLTSSDRAGSTVDVDNTKTVGGGYVVNNSVSGMLDQTGFHRTAQAAGRAKGLINDVTSYVAPVKSALSSMKPSPEVVQQGRDAARAAEQATRDATRKAEQTARDCVSETARRTSTESARTARTLQNQSRTSQLPKSNGPSPKRYK